MGSSGIDDRMPQFEDDVPEGHERDEWGDHNEDVCYACLLKQEATGPCRCGVCCRRLLIEVSVRDAEREPKIRELGSPIYTDARLTASGKPELEGYLLNSHLDMACVFLDQQTNLCTIHDTRPLTCRLFDCQGEGREQLIELGILHRDGDETAS